MIPSRKAQYDAWQRGDEYSSKIWGFNHGDIISPCFNQSEEKNKGKGSIRIVEELLEGKDDTEQPV